MNNQIYIRNLSFFALIPIILSDGNNKKMSQLAMWALELLAVKSMNWN